MIGESASLRATDRELLTASVAAWRNTNAVLDTSHALTYEMAAPPRAEKNEKRRSAMMNWSVWRQHAAESLGAVGGKDERAFLEALAKATKDSYVAKACRTAIAAIEKRLASPSPKPWTAADYCISEV